MKALIILITSSLFLSSIPGNIEQDSVEEILVYELEKKDIVKIETTINSRMPIIIVKKD